MYAQYLVFLFDVILYEVIHPRRITIIKCNNFTGNKIGENIHGSFIEARNFFVDNFVVK